MNRNRMRRWSRAALLVVLGSGLAAGALAAPAAGAPLDTPVYKAAHTDRTSHADRDHGRHRGGDRGRSWTVDYVALGDSYAAGYGGGEILDACGRTAEGYPALLDALRGIERDADQSCAGATALTTPPPAPAGPVDLPEQIAALQAQGALNRQTDLITLTIGGNDVRFGEIVAACAGPELPPACAPALEAATAYAQTTVAAQLQESLGQLRALAPRAELVLVGYPHLFEAGAPGPLSPEAVALFSQGTDTLNAILAAQLDGNSTFVDVVDEFAGHGVGSADPWIRFEGGPFDLHPNATGYRDGYLAAIAAEVDLRPGHGSGHCHGHRR